MEQALDLLAALFFVMDKDRDGVLSKTEIQEYVTLVARELVGCVNIALDAGKDSVTQEKDIFSAAAKSALDELARDDELDIFAEKDSGEKMISIRKCARHVLISS